MLSKRNAFLLLGAVVVAGALLAGYWFVLRSAPELCALCSRHISDKSRAVVEVSGKTEPACCVRCALTLERQQRQTVKLIQVTDYISGKPLSPDTAYYVEGSRVMLCEHHEGLIDESKRPFELVFDRCVPSVIAFAGRKDANAFASANGGSVVTIAEVLQEVKSTQ